MGTGPDPKAAKTSAELVATMRQLRSWADLSYRQLERRANDAGDALPRATISGVLAREDLPREELLAAFVRACGGDAATVDTWLDARRQLAMSSESAAPSPDEAGEVAAASPVSEPCAVDGTVAAEDLGSVTSQSTSPDTAGDTTGTDIGTSTETGTGLEDSEGEVPEAAEAAAPSDGSSAMPSEPGDPRSRRRYLPMALTGACAAAGVLLLALWPGGTTPDSALPDDGPRTTTSPPNAAPPTTSPSPSGHTSPNDSEPGTDDTTDAPNPGPTAHPTRTPSKVPATPTPAGMPQAGWVRMHPAGSSSLCITEGRERNGRTDREIAVQRPCAEAPQPRVYLESLGNQIYRIQWHRPEFGKGCLGVDESPVEGSELLSPGDCTDAPALRYRLDPSGSGYRLRPMDSGMCIGILPPRTDGAEAIQAPCTGATDQVFRFSPL
ncbi:RICIN domain-containing protein [Streptomyces sp.]|uniref:RICIN domain-containing protein n=1 Tax=Streptomyces sp. TaxID=1931 RepID=UPI002D79010E|nr:helix-turn-helix domain-containing protein [Streptomyces sp.]HET6356394.1 helix-turn-helix domain-containing protein [Streptomyces sp.]